MSGNWIVANLENAFDTWNDKMAEIWSLVTTSPQNYKGGAIWRIIQGINGGLQAVGLALLVLFFAMSVFKSTASFKDFQIAYGHDLQPLLARGWRFGTRLDG